MQAAPPVAIGLPVRNGEKYLHRAIGDLLGQTFGDFELLISDNQSDDGTEEICREAADGDRRITYVRQSTNIGAAANYNFVFNETSAPLFRWAPHDDGCAPTHLERCVEAFEHAPSGTTVVYPKTVLMDAEGRETGVFEDRMHMPWASARKRLAHFALNWQLCNALMGLLRRDAVERTRLIDTFVSSDVVTLAELALQGPVVEVPEGLFYRRIHADSAMQGGNTDAATWLDPAAESRARRSPRSTLPLMAETMRSIAKASAISPTQRAWISAWFGGAWFYRRARVNAGLAKRSLLKADERVSVTC